MKISCVIPTCDRPKLLAEAIESVLNQIVLPDEIIVVNNGKDKVILPENVLKKIRVYDIVPYAGASQARNFGASVAKGKYLAFLDDDDLWSKNYIKNNLLAIKKGALCVLNRIDIIVDNKLFSQKNPHGRISLDKLLVQNPGAGGSNIVISKNIFMRLGGYDVNLLTSEDKSLIIEIVKEGIKIETLPDNNIIANYNEGLGRLTNNKTISEGIYQFIKKYKKIMTKKQYLYNYLKVYRYRYNSGSKIAGLQYIFIKFIYYFIKIF